MCRFFFVSVVSLIVCVCDDQVVSPYKHVCTFLSFIHHKYSNIRVVVLELISVFACADPVVLACPAILRPSRPCQVSAVCHGHVQSASAGLRCAGGHERHPEVSDSPR